MGAMTYQHLLTLEPCVFETFLSNNDSHQGPIGSRWHLIFKRLFELHQGSEGQLMALMAFSTLNHLDLLAMSKAFVEST